MTIKADLKRFQARKLDQLFAIERAAKDLVGLWEGKITGLTERESRDRLIAAINQD